MADPYVRAIGRVTDMDGKALRIGVDYDTVTVGSFRFTQAQAGEFAQLFLSAAWQAAWQDGRMNEPPS